MDTAATLRERATRFRDRHARGPVLVLANPWDVGSARWLASMGFEALATSSRASAAALGLEDGGLGRGRTLAHARAVVEACDLPVSADLGDGFGDTPEAVAETIRRAGAIGLAGGSIEDAPSRDGRAVFDLPLAVDRVAAAVEAARGLAVPFVVTARAENFLRGRAELEDTIRRLLAFERAGADVLFAPGLPTLDSVRAVCTAVSKPVNFMAGIPGRSFRVADLESAGVRRISLGASLHAAAMAGLHEAAREVIERGTFGYVDASTPLEPASAR